MTFIEMPSKKNPDSLEMLCLETMVQAYALMIPNILHSAKAVAKARTATLEQWPRRIVCQLVPMLLRCTQLQDVFSECDVNLLYKFLITPVVWDVCLIPGHSVPLHHNNCNFQINLDLFPSGFMKFLPDPAIILQDLVSVGSSKLLRLHIPRLPRNICEIVANLPNLKCLWVVKEQLGCEEEEAKKLKSFISYLESEARMEEIHLEDFRISQSIISIMTRMKQVKVLDIRNCEVSVEDAANLVWKLPNMVEFGWSNKKHYHGNALLELCKAVKELDEDRQCLRKLKKWIGFVELNCLLNCDPFMFELMKTDYRGPAIYKIQLPELQLHIGHLYMTGNFGIVSNICQHLTSDSRLTRFLFFNGHLITRLGIFDGPVPLTMLRVIRHVCQNLNCLDICLTCKMMNSRPEESLDTMQSSSEMLKLYNLKIRLQDIYGFPWEVLSTIERDCLKELLCSCPNVTTLSIDMKLTSINNEEVLDVLPSKMNSLKHLKLTGWFPPLLNRFRKKIQEIAPNLENL